MGVEAFGITDGEMLIETFAALRWWFSMLTGQSCSGDCQKCVSQGLSQRLSRPGTGQGIFCILTWTPGDFDAGGPRTTPDKV